MTEIITWNVQGGWSSRIHMPKDQLAIGATTILTQGAGIRCKPCDRNGSGICGRGERI